MDDLTKYIRNFVLRLMAETLALIETDEERRAKLEEYSGTLGRDFRDADAVLKKKLAASGGKYAAEAIRSVEAYFAEKQAQMDGEPQQLYFTFDLCTEDGPKVRWETRPRAGELLRVDLAELKEDLRSKLDALYAEEPADETSDEYDDWEDRIDDLEDLLDEAEDRLEELEDEE